MLPTNLARVNLFLKLLGLVDPVPCTVLPNINLPTDSDGGTVDLNAPPSPSTLEKEMESSHSVRARHLQLEENLQRLEETSQRLDGELNIARHREILQELKGQVRAFKKEVKLNKKMDAVNAEQRAQLQEVLAARCQKLSGTVGPFALPRERRPP